MHGAEAAVILPERVPVAVALAVRVMVLVRVALAVRVTVLVRVTLAVRVRVSVRVTLAVRVTVLVRIGVAAGVVTSPLQVVGDHKPRCAACASACAVRNCDWY